VRESRRLRGVSESFFFCFGGDCCKSVEDGGETKVSPNVN
jgi:hypothetical protein